MEFSGYADAAGLGTTHREQTLANIYPPPGPENKVAFPEQMAMQ